MPKKSIRGLIFVIVASMLTACSAVNSVSPQTQGHGVKPMCSVPQQPNCGN